MALATRAGGWNAHLVHRQRRKGFWGFFATDPRTALSGVAAVVVFATRPSWATFGAALGVVAVGLAAHAWWARGHD